jgi:hypothetical protein
VYIRYLIIHHSLSVLGGRDLLLFIKVKTLPPFDQAISNHRDAPDTGTISHSAHRDPPADHRPHRYGRQHQRTPANIINQLSPVKQATCEANHVDQINCLATECPDHLSQIVAQYPKSLEIHGIHRFSNYKSPREPTVIIGQTQLPLSAALSCEIARTALADKLQLGEASLHDVGGRLSTNESIAVVTASDGDGFLYGTYGNLVKYTTVQLQQTRAGRILLDAANPSDLAAALTRVPKTSSLSPQGFKATLPPDSAPRQLPLHAMTLRQRVKWAVMNYGVDGAWQRITLLAVKHVPIAEEPKLAIHEIVYSNGRKEFADLWVFIGSNYVPLTVLASSSIGHAALGDLFTLGDGAQNLRLPSSAIRWTLNGAGLPFHEDPCEIVRLDHAFVLTWNVEGCRKEWYLVDTFSGTLITRALSMDLQGGQSTSLLPFTFGGPISSMPLPVPARSQILRTSAPPKPPVMTSLSRPKFPGTRDPSTLIQVNDGFQTPNTGQHFSPRSLGRNPQAWNDEPMAPYGGRFLRRAFGWVKCELRFA